MATLKNTSIDDINFLQLPVGTTAQRPASPTIGATRYNTSTNKLETYNGSNWITDDEALGSPRNPATSATEIYNNDNNSRSGIYYIKTPTEYVFPVYCKFDASGGWMNINVTWGPYGRILSGGTLSGGSGGGNMISTSRGDATQPLNGNIITNSQGNTYGCSGQPHRSVVQLTSIGQAMRADFNLTQVRASAQFLDNNGNVVCGYIQNHLTDRVNYNGTTASMSSVCDNTPRRWSDQNPSRFLYDVSGTLPTTPVILFESYSTCGGSFRMRLLELFVR